MSARILLVEDNSANIYLATFLLEQRGLIVEVARNGAEAVALARARPPNLILMDLHLPVLDGYEAARLLLAAPETAAVPIAALTAFAMTGDREKALAAGFCEYIEKPIDPAGFADQVGTLLRGPPPKLS